MQRSLRVTCQMTPVQDGGPVEMAFGPRIIGKLIILIWEGTRSLQSQLSAQVINAPILQNNLL